MSRVVPSQVVAFIDTVFPAAAKGIAGWKLTPDQHYGVAAIVELVDRIPAELLTLDAETNSAFISSKTALRESVLLWREGKTNKLKTAPGYGDNPVTLIRKALDRCADEAPTPGTEELDFIDDEELRKNLRIDISSVNSALGNGEWKAATVIAGSVCEALLLWRLGCEDTGTRENAIDILIAKDVLARRPDPSLEKWNLHQYIEVAAELEVIRAETTEQTRLAKDFRNLIHPGRAIRLEQECNRATALSAVAAVAHIVDNLKI